MNRWSKVTGIQSTIGIIFLMIFIILGAIAVSWGLTCLIVYWISLLWAETVFAFDWSWQFATGIWLALCLIGGFCSAKVSFND